LPKSKELCFFFSFSRRSSVYILSHLFSCLQLLSSSEIVLTNCTELISGKRTCNRPDYVSFSLCRCYQCCYPGSWCPLAVSFGVLVTVLHHLESGRDITSPHSLLPCLNTLPYTSTLPEKDFLSYCPSSFVPLNSVLLFLRKTKVKYSFRFGSILELPLIFRPFPFHSSSVFNLFSFYLHS